MYTIFTDKDKDECIKYIEEEISNNTCISIDIVFEDDLDRFLNYPENLKEIHKLEGSFQSYEAMEDKDIKRDRIYCGAEKNSISFKLKYKDIAVFVNIFDFLIEKKFTFEIRCYQ